MNDININEISPQELAFIGDAVYSLKIRMHLLSKYNVKSGKLHRESIKYVSAKAQAGILRKMQEILDNEELNIIKRGRNAYTPSVPKNMTIAEYRQATGLETLIGFLYLTCNDERLEYLVNKCIEIASADNI